MSDPIAAAIALAEGRLRPRRLVYIAGPYSRPDPAENTHRACLAWDALWGRGYAPYCPHWTMLQHLIRPRPAADWYEADYHWLLACDAVLRLPGESAGSDAECRLAAARGIPVFHDIEALTAALPPDADRPR